MSFTINQEQSYNDALRNAGETQLVLELSVNEFNYLRDLSDENKQLSREVEKLQAMLMEQDFSDWKLKEYGNEDDFLNPFSFYFPLSLEMLLKAGISFEKAKAFIAGKVALLELDKCFDESTVLVAREGKLEVVDVNTAI